MKKTVIGLSVVAGCLILASAVQAVELTYILEGTITQKNDPSHLVDMVSVGDKVTYAVVVQSDSTNASLTPGIGEYDSDSAILTIGPNVFVCNPPRIEIIANSSLSPQSAFNVPISTELAGSPTGGYFQLVDLQQTALPEVRLPDVPYDFAPFEWKDLSLDITNPNVYGDYSTVIGSFDRFTIVPEPMSWILLAWLGGVCSLQRRRTVTRG